MRVPSSVRSVAEVIGMDAAFRLMRATGSNYAVYIPAGSIPPSHRLASILKPEELRGLQLHFGGELLPYARLIGQTKARQAELRVMRIRAMHAQGQAISAIAQDVGCSWHYVRRVIREGRTSSGWTGKRKD